MTNDPKGSRWRKWDLHVHTPASIIQYYGNDDNHTWEFFINDLEKLPKEFKIIGINDYLFIDGYKKILEYKKNGKLKNLDLILPVIEFRIEKFVGVEFGKLKRINLHVIFSKEVEIETIESQFLTGLSQAYKIEKDGIKWNRSINRSSIEDLGKKIKESVPEEQLEKYGSDLEEGFNNLNFNEKTILELLERDCFTDKFLIGIGKTEWDDLKWSDSSIATKKDIINKAHVVFTAADSIEKCHKGKNKLKEQNVNDLLLDCSDAHYFSNSNEKDRIKNCFTWIKSDPTFEGLRQIIYESEARVDICEEPELLKRVKENKIKFIKSLRISQMDGYDEKKGVWFKDIEIPFNPGMVAIIGNKGSGKSAIVDILSLCGNSYQYKDFSFLQKDRFLKNGLAENFEAKLIWESGEPITKKLNEGIDENAPERLRYLPQHFFERLTNNLEQYEFDETLKKIVFSYLPDVQKLEKKSFAELINYKKEDVNKRTKRVLDDIIKLNETIIVLEKKEHPDYKKQLENNLELKNKEIEEHEKIKPKEVPNPIKDKNLTKEQIKKNEELANYNNNLKEIKNEIEEKRKNSKELSIEKEELEHFRNDLSQFAETIKNYVTDNKESYAKYGLSISEIIKFEIDFKAIKTKIKEKEDEIRKANNYLLTQDEIDNVLDPLKKQQLKNESPIIKKQDIEAMIERIKNELSKPEKHYQIYVENLKRWNDRKNEIEGDEKTIDTIKWLKKEIGFISSELENQLSILRKQRVEKSLKIYCLKNEIVDIYKRFKESIDNEIKKHQNILGEYEINIEAALKINQDLYEKFLGYINKKKKGSFYGIDEGKDILKKLIENTDFNIDHDAEKVLNEIIKLLEFDQREQFKNERRYITDQISENELNEFYTYVFSFKYLEPTYELRLSDKKISQLSPGEKGALLIVFYLILDKDNIPLIIDQPEENLDNESIFKILTHFIKETKKKRQLIMVTHNPNLAIVGDAEQIIFVEIDKKNGNKFSFESGAIENPKINKHASDILEGTLKAFDIRRLKYLKPNFTDQK